MSPTLSATERDSHGVWIPEKEKGGFGFSQLPLTWQINQPSRTRSSEVFVFLCYNKTRPTQDLCELLSLSYWE